MAKSAIAVWPGAWIHRRAVRPPHRRSGNKIENFPRPGDLHHNATTKSYNKTGEVNLREGPGTKYKVLRRIPKDTRINVIRIDGDWLRVESKKGNPPGYIDKRFAEKMP